MDKKRPISLVLSSGGARGIAHIGVIEELEKLGYNITSVTGTSIGSVIGAFYACGQLSVYRDWVLDLSKTDIYRLMDFTLDSKGFIKGFKVFRELKKIIPDRDISELDIPFTAIATDIFNRNEIVLNKGSMYDAIRASVAIPGFITPYRSGKKEYFDGGLINPMPLNKTIITNNEQIVAVNLNHWDPNFKPIDENEKKKEHQRFDFIINKWDSFIGTKLKKPQSTSQKAGMIKLFSEMFDLMQEQITSFHLQETPPDLLVKIPRNACNTFDFHKSRQLIELGRTAVHKALEEENVKISQ